MKQNAIRNAIIAAAVLVLAFFAACGDTPGSPSVADPRAVVMPMARVEPGLFTLGQNLGTWGGGHVNIQTDVELTQGST